MTNPYLKLENNLYYIFVKSAFLIYSTQRGPMRPKSVSLHLSCLEIIVSINGIRLISARRSFVSEPIDERERKKKILYDFTHFY